MGNSFVRFLVVGIVNTLVGLGATFGLRYGWGWTYWPSTSAGLAIGAAVSYFLNRRYTFRSTAPVAGSAIRFIVVVTACYVLAYETGYLLASFFVSPLQLSEGRAEDLAVFLGAALYTLSNYWGQRIIVFGFSRMRVKRIS